MISNDKAKLLSFVVIQANVDVRELLKTRVY
ncbi:hypothetical protein IUY40_14695 [Flavobacterium sp. ALJ2]|nr:hypothetical protein [Flavobacterium sp. ALJ2]